MSKRLRVAFFGLTVLCGVTIADPAAAPAPVQPMNNAAAPVATQSYINAPATTTASTVNSNLLSFNFQNISIRDLLQIIAKNAGLNFIISDSVKGSMSLSLQNVTWKEALKVVMRANGLDSRKYDNVIYIAPIDELAANDAKRFQAQQQLANLAPPVTSFIRLKYANANDLLNVIKGQQGTLLTSNGQIGVDPRTNTIWVYDNPTNVIRVKSFIKQLDVPAKQVLIEARIVSVDTEYVEQLGIRWGVTDMNGLSGTLKGGNATRQGEALADIPIDERLNFNIPANSVFGSTPASMALALVQLGDYYLDAEISALEGEDHAQVISNPRVITSNLQKALIQTGEEIPYQEATSSGATSVAFKEAVLSLEITPQITSNNSLVLNIKVTRNKRGTPTQISGGGVDSTTSVPAIDTEEIQSLVVLKNDQTVVLGGVYKLDKQNQVVRVPFLGSLPVVGALFRHTSIDNKKSELLIFITPKIINQAYDMAPNTPNEVKLNNLGLKVSTGNSNVFDKKTESDKSAD